MNTSKINALDRETFTAEWALSPTPQHPKPHLGAPTSQWSDYNAALSMAGMKRNRRKELGIGEFAAPAQATHTPGEWTTGQIFNCDTAEDASLAVFANPKHRQEGCTKDGAVICVIAPPAFTTEEDRANARLIAAAPELLAALHHAINLTLDEEDEAHVAFLAKARAAIAKAGGAK